MSRRPSPFTLRLAGIAAAALAVRVAYTLLIAKDTSGIGDFFFYHGQANLLAEGRGFVHPLFYLEGIVAPSAEHPPLWPMVLSVTSWLGGTGFEAHRLTGCVLGALASWWSGCWAGARPASAWASSLPGSRRSIRPSSRRTGH